MTVTWERLNDDGVLTPMQQALADTLQRLDHEVDPQVILAAMLVSDQVARGHVCLDLATVPELTFIRESVGENRLICYQDWPDSDGWLNVLSHSNLVEVRNASDTAAELQCPLVLDVETQRLYFARHWFYQQQLGQHIAMRLAETPLLLNESQLTSDLAGLFPGRHQVQERDQCIAAANAIDQHFSVITGGPGTGKTTTVAKLLALRLLQAESNSTQPLKVLLMAPTGKAAQRLNESLAGVAQKLLVDDHIKAQLRQVSAGTIHRVLGWTPQPPEQGGPFRHNAMHPLDADVVLVDESSMVDLGLMWHLVTAVRPAAQLILMGDRDQLASVEAGGVLSDLCATDHHSEAGFSADRALIVAGRTGLTDLKPAQKPSRSDPRPLNNAVVTLKYSHRFSANSDLGLIADAIRTGSSADVIKLLRSADPLRIMWIDRPHYSTAVNSVIELAAEQYRPYLELLQRAETPSRDILMALARTRVLCAHREGPGGGRLLNQRIAQRLAETADLRIRPGDYPGRAVMVRENDYQQELFNGDVGVVTCGAEGGLGVLFDDPQCPEGYRIVPAALAPATNDCWAMTIHKSQGSEYSNVFVLLPEIDSPVLSRELLYTAVTRVKDEIDESSGIRSRGYLCLVASETVLRQTIERGMRRNSGIRDSIETRLARRETAKASAPSKPRKSSKQKWLWDDR